MIETPLRQRLDLSLGWEFVQRRVDRGWLRGRGDGGEMVNLPHCWNDRDTFQYGRRSYSGWGAYRRIFELPPTGGGFWRLRSEGFYGVGEVWLDGARLARVDGQYLGFDIDLPVRDPDFLLHGGLAGRVWIERVPALHIDTDRVEIVCTRGPDGAEVLELRCAVNGLESSPKNGRLSWTVTAADGAPIAAAEPVSIGDGTVVVSTTFPKPRCWSPENPQLYWADSRLETDEGPADVVRVRFGITRAEFRPDEGFFLDGARVDLHGCNRHAAIPGFGNALPEELHRADAKLLVDYGCNFVRLSHYPQHPAFLDACDELGIMVYPEIASWKSVRSARGWRRAARRQMRDLILRDRHHPSVILWGMGNESRSRKVYVELKDIAGKLDPGRPVTYAENHLYRARRQHTVGIPDVWAVNYELDMQELTQVATLEREWELMMDRPYLAGHAVWSLTDYATEHRRRFRRQTGLFDAWRRPKMAAELFRARYAEEPFVSLFVIRVAEACELHVFSNCGRVELTLDGEPFATLEGALHHRARIDGGFEEIRASGVRQGIPTEAVIRRWGEATSVGLTINDTTPSTGKTLAVDLVILDADGVPVRDWNGHVHLEAEGDARLRTYTDTNEVLMARGEGRAYLTLGDREGEVVVTALAGGLAVGTATFRLASPGPSGTTDQLAGS